jgi:hypothetical protein
MASIAGPRIAEIKVRHHARQFGKSKYGISRVYRVLLDLLVIKTLASFLARPLRWFWLLSMPLFLAGVGLLGGELIGVLTGTSLPSLPIAGAGLIFLSGAFILASSGALAEMLYDLGDVRDHEFARLTSRVRTRACGNG